MSLPAAKCKPGDLVIVVGSANYPADAWAIGTVLTVACVCRRHSDANEGTYWNFGSELRDPQGRPICCGSDAALRPIRPPRPGQVTQQPRELEAA